MKIDSNTTAERVKEKMMDSLNLQCDIKNNESDNGKNIKELFEKYRTGRLSTSRKTFNEYDFIRLFLSMLVKKGIIKFDSVNLAHRLIYFYRNCEYNDLFDMPVVSQIEGDYIDMSSCLAKAYFCGLISAPIQATSDRLILIPNADEIINEYKDEYKIKMRKLVESYLLQQEETITPSDLVIGDINYNQENTKKSKQLIKNIMN